MWLWKVPEASPGEVISRICVFIWFCVGGSRAEQDSGRNGLNPQAPVVSARRIGDGGEMIR